MMKLLNKNNNKNIKFIKCKNDIPFVLVQFKGSENVYSAMIDTGCEVTVLDSSIMKEINDINTSNVENVSLNGFGGGIKCDNCVNFAVEVSFVDESNNDISIPVAGIVSSFKTLGINKALEKIKLKDKVAMIIGSNTLNDIEGSVDFKKRILKISNYPYTI